MEKMILNDEMNCSSDLLFSKLFPTKEEINNIMWNTFNNWRNEHAIKNISELLIVVERLQVDMCDIGSILLKGAILLLLEEVVYKKYLANINQKPENWNIRQIIPMSEYYDFYRILGRGMPGCFRYHRSMYGIFSFKKTPRRLISDEYLKYHKFLCYITNPVLKTVIQQPRARQLAQEFRVHNFEKLFTKINKSK